MSRFVRNLVVVASLFSIFAAADLAQANHIQSTVNRRQHANGSFFEKTPHHQAATSNRSLLTRLFASR